MKNLIPESMQTIRKTNLDIKTLACCNRQKHHNLIIIYTNFVNIFVELFVCAEFVHNIVIIRIV